MPKVRFILLFQKNICLPVNCRFACKAISSFLISLSKIYDRIKTKDKIRLLKLKITNKNMKRIIILSSLGAGLLLASFKGTAPKVSKYMVNPSQSKVEWVGKKVTGEHAGTVDISDGYLLTQKGQVVSGRFEIDMTSLKNTDITDPTGNSRMVGHLKSADFFDVGNHKSALLVIKRILPYKGEKNATHSITGDLTIKGITNEITFPATLIVSKSGVSGTAAFTIDRTKWDIRYGSKTFFESIGDKAIYDDIQFNVSIATTEWKK